MPDQQPRIIVFSTLFPSPSQPGAGLFIRERMFRVAQRLPLVVVSPQPWFPLQRVIRWFAPNFRLPTPAFEMQGTISIYRPRFFCVPRFLKNLDGFFMALGAFSTVRMLKKSQNFNLIDAHFGYPDGYAATMLGHWLKLPVTITLRGTETGHANDPARRPQLMIGLMRATRIFSVSASLKAIAESLGIPGDRIRVVGNGVDLTKFYPVGRDEARRQLALPLDAKILISVGGLVERKGFHRVIACLPALCKQFPNLYYLIVGGASAEGNIEAQLRQQTAQLGLQERVRFLGVVPPEQLKISLSAADVFVLATRNEGWANVFLEAMACGLPVVTTDVGGNREVINDPELGMIVPFGDGVALEQALYEALAKSWDRTAIRRYAEANDWEGRVDLLCELFRELAPPLASH
ncbi:MAG TPA: glycosyltransferase [Candidatus Competibacteraceae bacterium]|nr:glycosyltransferase [Candidatus Competibacteraceae bacterium]